MTEAPATAPSLSSRKFLCGQCGADVVWHPGAGALRCDYCGFVRSLEEGPREPVLERALASGLENPEKTGWGAERRSWKCGRCGAVESLEPGIRADSCAFCGTPGVVEAPADAELVRPQGVLPFKVTRADALGRFRTWLAGLWFRPNDLRRRAQLDSVRGVYVPFWTFDAATFSHWRAEAGHRRGSGKKSRIEWRPASGTLQHFFDDLPVPASRGLDHDLALRLEPFPTAELVPYDPQYLAGFLAEEYGTDLAAAHAIARERMIATLETACRAEVPGELCRNLVVETSWSGLAYKSGLLPVWIAAYLYRGKPFQFVVNGVTGLAAGTAPWSAAKIVLAVLAAGLVLLFVLSR